MNQSLFQNIPHVVRKAALMLLVIVAYFLMMRPAREYYHTHAVWPLAAHWIDSGADTSTSLEPKSSKSFYLTFSMDETQKQIVYSPQAGFFWLLATLSLIFITLKWHYYLFLFILHLIFEGVVVAGLWAGAACSPLGFIVADFIISYLSPVISLGMIPTVLLYRNKGHQNINHL
ncbi:MAG: hypothetical protein U5J95_00030 [Balneolaceae bacterium]|nr:hypothetical protein [Balneolaceae bacterium]